MWKDLSRRRFLRCNFVMLYSKIYRYMEKCCFGLKISCEKYSIFQRLEMHLLKTILDLARVQMDIGGIHLICTAAL